MSEPNADVIANLYAAFGRGDVPGVLAMLDENIAWRAPENLPHGGTFSGREEVGVFFQGLGGMWDGLAVKVDDIISGGDRVISLVRANGTLRSTGDQTGYSGAHAWTMRDGVPVRFDEYVDAPPSLPPAGA